MPTTVDQDQDRELRKRIAESEAADQGSIFTRALQFFVVPLAIVAACLVVYLSFKWMSGGGVRGTPDIIRDLREGGPKARAQAALELAEVLRRDPDAVKKDPSLVGQLVEAYRSLPSDPAPAAILEVGAPLHIKILLVQCLGLIGDPAAVPLLIEEAKTAREELRPHCIQAVGGCKDPSVVPDLVKLLDSDSGVIRKYAANALGMLRDRRAIEPLKGRLGDARADVQWNAACALAFYFQDGSGIPVLHRMLDRTILTQTIGKDDNATELVSQAMVTALNAVVALGDPQFLATVEGLAKNDPDAGVRFTASKALDRMKAK